MSIYIIIICNYILFFFILGVLVANLIGLKGISRTICFIIPIAIISVIITFFTTAILVSVCFMFTLDQQTGIDYNRLKKVEKIIAIFIALNI